jgi:hypothetical protein
MTSSSSIKGVRVMSVATAAYAVYALAKPEHLGRAIGSSDPMWDTVARIFGVRDLAVSAVGVFGPPTAARAALAIRCALDFGDAAALGATLDGEARTKVLGVAGGWGLLNLTVLKRSG